MLNFKKINKMIDLIEESQIMEGMTFNEFAMEFYSEVKLVPLSRYLKTNNKVKRMPKIMNMRKAGELLLFTKTDDETLSFLKRKGYNEMPSLDYKTIMLLRKLDPIDNWKKILAFLNGDKTVEEINMSTRPILFPQEIKKLEEYIKDELNLNDEEFEKFMSISSIAVKNKEVMKAIKKLISIKFLQISILFFITSSLDEPSSKVITTSPAFSFSTKKLKMSSSVLVPSNKVIIDNIIGLIVS